MAFGNRLWRLWQLRTAVVGCLLLSIFAAVWSLNKVTLLPPSISPRSIEMATASTHLVVDTPESAILDLRQDTYGLEGLTNRSVLLGNVIANGRVRESTARTAGIDASVLRVTPPLTPEEPQARADSGEEKHIGDILKSNDQYRLSIVANPTVPVLDIYSQAPTAATAEKLADGAVSGLKAYVGELAAEESTPDSKQIRLIQLGRARGAVINEGMSWQVALVAFLVTFGASSASVLFLSRVRKGWRHAAGAERGMAGV
jgi:hypothetical protein